MTFDIIAASSSAFRFLVRERGYLARIALVPVVVKLLCQAGVEASHYDANFIRQALIMLPSYLLDGWVAAHVVRFALYGQRWPFREIKTQRAGIRAIHVLRDRAVGVLTGTLTFATVRFLGMGVLAALDLAGRQMQAAHWNAENTPPWAVAGALILMCAGLWAVRLQFLYIPAAAGIGMGRFLKGLGGFGASFTLLGAWLACAIPVLLVLVLATALVIAPSGGAAAFSKPGPVLLLIACWSVADTLITILSSHAIATGLKPVLEKARSA